jgi:hypothetical protein
MKRIHTLALALTLAPLFAVTSGCDPKEEAPKPAAVPAAPVIQPTVERALSRSQERWNHGVKNEWVAAYDYFAPEAKKEVPLANYLSGMQVHRYENMRSTDVLAIQGDKAYVRVTGLWTAVGPQVQRVKLEPGQTLTQEIVMIETWRFVDGDWCFVRPERDTDFFEKHPDLLKQTKQEPAPTPPPAK